MSNDSGDVSKFTGTAGDSQFPFSPGNIGEAGLDSWPENTVDVQDLQGILAGWQLSVEGLVDAPFQLTFGQLVAERRTDTLVDFHCVEGWTVEDVPWNGVHLSVLFDHAGTQNSATHVTFYARGGIYVDSLPIAVALEPKTLFAYGIAGNTLPLAHGFPARVVIPRLFGYKNAKYIERIELTDHPVTGFWEQAGYSYDAEVPAARLRDGKY